MWAGGGHTGPCTPPPPQGTLPHTKTSIRMSQGHGTMTAYTGQCRYGPSRSQPGTQTPTPGPDLHSPDRMPTLHPLGSETGPKALARQGEYECGGQGVVDRGFDKERARPSFGEGQRVRAEQLGTGAEPGQSEPEEGGGPGWMQAAGGRWGEDRAHGQSTWGGRQGSERRPEGASGAPHLATCVGG